MRRPDFLERLASCELSLRERAARWRLKDLLDAHDPRELTQDDFVVFGQSDIGYDLIFNVVGRSISTGQPALTVDDLHHTEGRLVLTFIATQPRGAQREHGVRELRRRMDPDVRVELTGYDTETGRTDPWKYQSWWLGAQGLALIDDIGVDEYVREAAHWVTPDRDRAGRAWLVQKRFLQRRARAEQAASTPNVDKQ